MNFEEARGEYVRLRRQLEYRQLAPDDFARRVQTLQVLDPRGTYWSIDGATGAWLRFDGTRWLPDSPPVPSAYAPPPTGYSVAAGPPVTPGYRAAIGAAPASGAQRALITIVAAFVTLAIGILIAGAMGVALGQLTFDTSTGIIDPVVASGIGADNRPVAAARDFAPGSDVYITFTARRMRAGENVTVRALRDGQPVPLTPNTNVLMVHRDATYHAAIVYRPAQVGSYQIELFLGNATAPTATLSFSVR